MKRNVTLAVFCFSVLSVFLVGAGRATPKLAPGACTDPDLPKDARCGTYEVFENRATKKGRKIPLRVVVLPALGPDRLPDPVVYFTGGPGGSSVFVRCRRREGRSARRQGNHRPWHDEAP